MSGGPKVNAGDGKVRLADNTFVAIAGTRTVPLAETLTLVNVLHVPDLAYNLISVSRLTKASCDVNFRSSKCVSGNNFGEDDWQC